MVALVDGPYSERSRIRNHRRISRPRRIGKRHGKRIRAGAGMIPCVPPQDIRLSKLNDPRRLGTQNCDPYRPLLGRDLANLVAAVAAIPCLQELAGCNAPQRCMFGRDLEGRNARHRRRNWQFRLQRTGCPPAAARETRRWATGDLPSTHRICDRETVAGGSLLEPGGRSMRRDST
jgi:hypothetical protein